MICNQNGEIVATVPGPSTNHWMTGIPECANRIAIMVNSGKTEANIPHTIKLKSLGLSLSGCEQVHHLIIFTRFMPSLLIRNIIEIFNIKNILTKFCVYDRMPKNG